MIPIETVHSDAFTMDFFRFGQGQKIMVILPGLSITGVMGSADAIAAAYAPMEKDFTVYVFDRRAQLPPAYSVGEMAADTVRALQTLGLDGVYLFGASQGGMMAMEIALGHPRLVRKMVLGSASARVGAAQYRGLERWIRLAGRKDRVGLYLDFGKTIYPPAVFQQYRQALTDAAQTVTDADLARFIVLAQGTKDFNAADRLNRIRCPVLVLGARDDALLGPDAAPEMAQKLAGRPDCAFYLYDGYGHAAFDTAPDYKQRILRFFMQQ